jgi:hypothetical protein
MNTPPSTEAAVFTFRFKPPLDIPWIVDNSETAHERRCGKIRTKVLDGWSPTGKRSAALPAGQRDTRQVGYWDERFSGGKLRVYRQENWCRREELGFPCVLKTGNLLKTPDAKNAQYGRIAPDWNVSGTLNRSLCIRYAYLGAGMTIHWPQKRPRLAVNPTRGRHGLQEAS